MNHSWTVVDPLQGDGGPARVSYDPAARVPEAESPTTPRDGSLVPELHNGSGAMFDRIAARYDLLNRLISFGVDQRWRRKLVAALELGASPHVLDLATGTGDVALRLAQAYPSARIQGLDPSTQMLARAEKKAAERRVKGRTRFVVGDAERLPFEDETFDGITMAFGIRNVVNRARALGEMHRVLRPGARVAILELSEPRGQGPLAWLARQHVHHLVPWLGSWLSGAAEYRYLQQSIAAFPPPAEFGQLVRGAKLEVVAIRPLTFGACCLYVGRRAP
jgi:demethylmenaquinone methyltransferase/2-methoxy-6-polyprenyl-1,4-benzoquinol methylase